MNHRNKSPSPTTDSNGYFSGFTFTDSNLSKLILANKELRALGSAQALLLWDQETYLTPKGALSRAFQLEVLSGLYHDRATAKEMGNLLSKVEEKLGTTPGSFSLHDKALVREIRRDFDLATKLPRALVQKISKHTSLGLEAWKSARIQKNFSVFESELQTMVELKKQAAEAIGYTDTPYNALLDEYEAGLTKAQIRHAFDALKKELVVLTPKLTVKTAPYAKGMFSQVFETEKLWKFSMDVLKDIGFDLERGRQDTSTHPFTMGIHPTDVRLTTRVIEDNPLSTLLSTIHEAGHGMYEQGIDPRIADTVLGRADSLIIHESQSRFWENMIGKSPEFWRWIFPKFQAAFPKQLKDGAVDDAWNEVNVVRPSFIRVDADEVTYHMHIVIRFEIESALIEGTLKVKDIPEAWNAAYKSYLGIDVPDDSLGCLQDIHWSQGLIGYFPTYSLGSLLSAQLYETLLKDHPDLPKKIEQGKFEVPLKWLNHSIHQHGKLYSSDDVAKTITGKPLDSEAYLTYIQKKFKLS